MELARIVVLSGVGFGCGWLAFGVWRAWGQAAESAASPDAVILPLLAGALAITSLGALLRVALMLRRRAHARRQ